MLPHCLPASLLEVLDLSGFGPLLSESQLVHIYRGAQSCGSLRVLLLNEQPPDLLNRDPLKISRWRLHPNLEGVIANPAYEFRLFQKGVSKQMSLQHTSALVQRGYTDALWSAFSLPPAQLLQILSGVPAEHRGAIVGPVLARLGLDYNYARHRFPLPSLKFMSMRRLKFS